MGEAEEERSEGVSGREFRPVGVARGDSISRRISISIDGSRRTSGSSAATLESSGDLEHVLSHRSDRESDRDYDHSG